MAKANPDDTGKASKLVLPLTESGTIDWDRVRPSAAKTLIELMHSDATIQEELHGADSEPSSDATPLEGITQENIGAVIDIIGRVNGLLLSTMCARFMKHPIFKDAKGKPLPIIIEPQTTTLMQFTKDQHKELDPKATRIAKKYSHKMPDWMKEHLDLYTFGLMFLQYTAVNAKTAIEVQLKRDLARVKAAQVQSVPSPSPAPETAPSKSNGVDHNPPPSFSGLTESEVVPPPEPPEPTV